MVLSVELDEELYRRARAAAERRGESLSALVRQYLEQLGEPADAQAAIADFVRLARRFPGQPEPGWRFIRAEMYETGGL